MKLHELYALLRRALADDDRAEVERLHQLIEARIREFAQ